MQIADPNLKTWAQILHGLWKELGRTISEDCKRQPERYTLIYVSHPFIIPGGRFREFYYWDSYWIQRGLLRSEMYDTTKGMIENFLEMVELMGFVPNGGRKYYRRSQPPLLIPMMKSYFDATQDIDFLRSSLATLEKEFKFWIKHRMVTVYHKRRKFRVARYSSDRTGPRPESYRFVWLSFFLFRLLYLELNKRFLSIVMISSWRVHCPHRRQRMNCTQIFRAPRNRDGIFRQDGMSQRNTSSKVASLNPQTCSV